MPRLIGVCASGQELKIGSIAVAIVVVDNANWFRKFSKLISNKKSTSEERIDLFNKTKDSLWFDLLMIQPQDLKSDPIGREAETIIEALNRCPQFWKEKVNIAFSDRTKLMDNIGSYLPHNLKKILHKLKYERWKILQDPFKLKILELAKQYSQFAVDREQEEIKQIWGDITDADDFIKTNTDCPHIR